MFSILIIEPDGNERLREDAISVRRVNHPIMKDGQVDVGPGVLILWSDGVETHFDHDSFQNIYVMNSRGATVANYRP